VTGPPPGGTWIVVPCFDEAHRLDADAFGELAAGARARVLLVDDGSTDATAAVAARIVAAAPDTFDLLVLPRNVGKGEAVRRGLLDVVARGADVVGYCDADLATPPAEMARLVDVLRADGSLHVVLGSRVAMLGTHIGRSATRHYTGRVFATAASLALGMVVYDTQCGAKVLRTGPALEAALAVPFGTRWAFDVALLGRLRYGGAGVDGLPEDAFREVPLATWIDGGGSKLRPLAAFRAGLDLARVGADLRRRR
jgi:glycosyltransferase involved in cell wall biosynthesis